jgi:hypothetical protein
LPRRSNAKPGEKFMLAADEFNVREHCPQSGP